MSSDIYRPPPSTDGTSWWMQCATSTELNAEAARRFAVNKADERTARQAGFGQTPSPKQRAKATTARNSTIASRGSVLMPTAHTMRSEFVQERLTVSELRGVGLL
jgi:hypothetical protein